YAKALPLFDAEIRLQSDSRRKAALMFAKGRVLEDYLDDPKRARAAYADARDLEGGNPSTLKALEQFDQTTERWAGLDQTYTQLATAVETDARHRAALIVRRAHLLELRHDDVRGAVELYETALHLDPNVAGAFSALKRLHHEQGRWRDLINVLEREAEQLKDADLRAMSYYRVARIYSERLGTRDKAIAALERSISESQRYRLVHEELIALYEAAERYDDQVRAYERLLALIESPRERISTLYTLGELYRGRINDEDAAIAKYEAALALEPTFQPTLKILTTLYRKRKDWKALVEMNTREAAAVSDNVREAAALARVAELVEEHEGDKERAITLHTRALALYAGFETSFKALARLFSEGGKHRELIELLERGIDETNDADRKIAYLFRIGDIFEQHLGSPVQSGHTYRRILKLDPNHLGAMHALQRASEVAGRYKDLVEALELEARNTFEKPRIVALLHRAGAVLDDRLDDREGALAQFRKVLELNPKYEPALASCGKLYYKAGRWDDLLAIYERELALDAESPAAVSLLHSMGALCEEKLGRDSQAIGCYRRAIQIDPRHGPSLHALQRKLRQRGDWKELVDALETELEGLRDKPARALTAYRIGRVYEEHLSDLKLALDAYQKSLSNDLEYRPAVDGLARVRAKEKKWSGVVEDLMREAKATKEPLVASSALLRAGEVWSEHLGQDDRAIACYEAVLERDERHLAALLSLEQLYRRKGAWNALVDTYLREAVVVGDKAAQVAALREVARLYETKPLGDKKGLRRAHLEILKRVPDDPLALLAVEQMALAQRDDQMLAAVDQQLVGAPEDDSLRATYLVRLGETLERQQLPKEALAAFESALDRDNDSIGAMQGMVRAAAMCDDPRAMVVAKSRLAETERDGETAAKLLHETAQLRLNRLDDSEGAIQDLERALERWPDSAEVAEELHRILLTVGKAERLVERLSAAAESARAPERIARLWLAVAELYADELGNTSGGIAILRRTLRDRPGSASMRMLLANLLHRNEQWGDAAKTFEQVIEQSSDIDILCDANSTLSVIYADQLNQYDRAIQCLEAVLVLRKDDRTTLRMLTDVYTRKGDLQGAAERARQLLRASSTLEERIESIIHLAEIQMNAGRRGEALEVLLSAVQLEGPGGLAAREYKRRLEEGDSWEPYESALMKHLRSGSSGKPLAETYLELARVQYEKLQRPDRSLATLEMALNEMPKEPLVRLEYATMLRAASRHSEAIRAYQKLLQFEPTSTKGWRGLVQSFVETKRGGEAALSLAPLVVLGDASDADVRSLGKLAPAPASAKPGTLTASLLQSLVDRAPQAERAEELLRTMAPALGKLYPVDLQKFGVTAREKISARSGQPIRNLTDRIAAIFGVPDHDLFIYRGAGTLVSADYSYLPTILIPATVLKLSESQQVFTIARAMVSVARGLIGLYRFKPLDLKLILAAAARSGAPSFGDNLADGAELDVLQRRIFRAMPRKDRRLLEEASSTYAKSPAVDFVAWLKEHRVMTTRAAAILASDLPGCVAVMRQEDQSLMYLEGADIVNNSELIADLMRYWCSDPAIELRRRSGMLA
ncbi:MAG: tetratricopeptide repeat protein, partial [Myxococcales bacterium]|nr:tetratricopeptide repeat protein [Myxococcales bacterium]